MESPILEIASLEGGAATSERIRDAVRECIVEGFLTADVYLRHHATPSIPLWFTIGILFAVERKLDLPMFTLSSQVSIDLHRKAMSIVQREASDAFGVSCPPLIREIERTLV